VDIAAIPYHRLIGIRAARAGEYGMVALDDAPGLHNHLGTIHASAQYALAEACSGAVLLARFGDLADEVVPVVRRAQVKYRHPARATLYASASLTGDDEARVRSELAAKVRSELAAKGRSMVEIDVRVADSAQVVVLTATLGWFLQRAAGGAVHAS